MGRMFALVLLLIGAAVALGDGMFTPLGGINKPTLPYQRAILFNHNGVETMIVQSTLNGQAGSYAWIVPLPSPPTKIDDVDAFQFDFRVRRFEPIVRDFSPPFLLPWLAGFLLCCGLAAAWQPARDRAKLVLLLGGLGVCGMFLLQTRNQVHYGAEAASAVQTLQSLTVGPYKVDVVRSSDPHAMAAWLRKHGGKLPAEAEPAVAAYVKEGWCFMAAKLVTDTGYGAPDPLAVTFPSEKTIYPMRLTGAQGNRLVVDLYVVADGTAWTPGLRAWLSTKIPKSTDFPQYDVTKDFKDDPLACLSWPGYCVTRLRGAMGPDQMKQDIVVGTRPFKSEWLTLGDRNDFNRWAMLYTLIAAGISGFVGGFLCSYFLKSRALALAIVAGCALLGAGVTSIALHAGVKPYEGNKVEIE